MSIVIIAIASGIVDLIVEAIGNVMETHWKRTHYKRNGRA